MVEKKTIMKKKSKLNDNGKNQLSKLTQPKFSLIHHVHEQLVLEEAVWAVLTDFIEATVQSSKQIFKG